MSPAVGTGSSLKLLCVGSGMAPRYRANTLQALALPIGAQIQFRYRDDLIPDALKKKLETGAAIGALVLLGHVDGTALPDNADGPCTVVPYREAQLIDARRVGSFFTLQLQLRKRRWARELADFQKLLGSESPHWDKSESGDRPVGKWCQELPDAVDATTQTVDLGHWEQVTKQLKQQRDFAQQSYFYLFEGIYEVRSPRWWRRLWRRLTFFIKPKERGPVRLTDGAYRLGGKRDYELRIIHFAPGADAHASETEPRALRVETAAPLASRSDPLLKIDSPYDAKSYHFSTMDTPFDQYSSLALRPESTEPLSAVADIPELYFTVLVRTDLLSNVGRGFILGTLLWMGQLVPALVKKFGDHTPGDLGLTDLVTFVLTATLSYVTAFWVISGLKKPL